MPAFCQIAGCRAPWTIRIEAQSTLVVRKRDRLVCDEHHALVMREENRKRREVGYVASGWAEHYKGEKR